MSIRKEDFKLIQIALDKLNDGSFKGLCIGELGNQKLYDEQGKNRGPFKKVVEMEHGKHISFDLNGEDGALKIDLSKPVPKEFINKFDILTNCGTSEHITNAQIEVFRNIHKMTKLGGYMVHSIPYKGCWSGHSPHKYTKYFIEKLSKSNDYTMLFSNVQKRRKNDYIVLGLLQKTKEEFSVSDLWVNEIVNEKYKINKDNLK